MDRRRKDRNTVSHSASGYLTDLTIPAGLQLGKKPLKPGKQPSKKYHWQNRDNCAAGRCAITLNTQTQETIAYQDPWAQASLISKTSGESHAPKSFDAAARYLSHFLSSPSKRKTKILSLAPTVPVTLEAHQRRAEAL